MGKPAWVIPVAVLSALCVAMFAFIWWWYVSDVLFHSTSNAYHLRFPRTWKKGTQQEMKIWDAEIARRRDYDRRREEALRQAEIDGVEVDIPKEPPRVFTYQPPAYSTY